MNDKSKILNMDVTIGLRKLSNKSVHCVITSPPYWGLRDYGIDGQIGLEPTPEEYIEKMILIFREVKRVLRDDGTLWLNIGDLYTKQKVIPSLKLKPKDLVGIPWRLAFALQEDGWILRSRITWIKKSAMPESVKNRPTNATEDIFLFTKSIKYYYDPDGVREPTGANLRNYWILGPDPNAYGHPAAFPRELARRCILLGSREGDTILDPFGGCGTTGIASQELNRKSILIEINPSYVETDLVRAKKANKIAKQKVLIGPSYVETSKV